MTDRTGITLRLTPADREALDALKSYLREPAASRALLHITRLYPQQHQALQATLDELAQARADSQQLLDAVATAEQARLDLINTASDIASRITDVKMNSRSFRLDYDEDILQWLNMSQEQFDEEARLVLAAWLCKKGILSTGAAAEFAGIPKVLFLKRMGEFGIPAFDLTPEELEQELDIALRFSGKVEE